VCKTGGQPPKPTGSAERQHRVQHQRCQRYSYGSSQRHGRRAATTAGGCPTEAHDGTHRPEPPYYSPTAPILPQQRQGQPEHSNRSRALGCTWDWTLSSSILRGTGTLLTYTGTALGAWGPPVVGQQPVWGVIGGQSWHTSGQWADNASPPQLGRARPLGALRRERAPQSWIANIRRSSLAVKLTLESRQPASSACAVPSHSYHRTTRR
jgi:hypothetical protein